MKKYKIAFVRDGNHAFELLNMMKYPAYRPAQDAYAGYVSKVRCICRHFQS